MKLKPFGERQTSWSEQSLSDLIGHIGTLVENEAERVEGLSWNGPLTVRLDLVERARQLLEVADNGDVRIIRAALRELKQGNKALSKLCKVSPDEMDKGTI